MPGYAPDPGNEEFAQSRVCFAELEEWLSGPEAGRLTHAEIEEQLDARGRELLRLLHQDHLDLRAAREERRAGVTGADEGACRHLVKDRMDITGARWGLDGAEAILKLRALTASGGFDDYWRFHLQQEHQRVHRARYGLAA